VSRRRLRLRSGAESPISLEVQERDEEASVPAVASEPAANAEPTPPFYRDESGEVHVLL
jgi:hypothetical protein